MTEDQQRSNPAGEGTLPEAPAASVPPEVPETRYEKPKLRRYDQIDQVRPYGPAEV